MKAIQILSLAVAAAVTATGNGTAIDVTALAGEGRLVLNSSAGTGADNTLDCKLQDSADGVTWADTGHTFAQVTNAAASHQVIAVNIDTLRKNLRIVDTVAGTAPSFTRGAELVGKLSRV